MARLALALALCFVGAANGFGVTPPAREECPDVNIDGPDESPAPTCGEAGEACDIFTGEDIFRDGGVCLQIEIPDVSTGAYIKLPRRVWLLNHGQSPRHRRDASSMTWRCGSYTTRAPDSLLICAQVPDPVLKCECCDGEGLVPEDMSPPYGGVDPATVIPTCQY